ncbi:hypothetical protein [Nocardia sp. NPDC052566]|uniref:LppU family putative lipoprotein n=1 Tax=Nocardia sp. NPDC052566 TaxID=3364330 RepID=UPI0037C76C29
MTGQLNWGRLAMAGVAVLAAVALTACGQTISGRALPANGTIDAVSATNTPKTTSGKPSSTARPTTGRPNPSAGPTPTAADRGGNTDFEANIGDCVTLGGSVEDATIAKAPCGSRTANYKVIGKTQRSSQCAADSDSYYVETINGVEQGAFCLDIDWVVDGCMDVGGDIAKRIDCTGSKAKDGVRMVKIAQNTTDVNSCAVGNRGFVKKERRFVVCVKDI